MEIQRATRDNLLELQEIAKQTFVETFAHSNDKDDINKYIEDAFSVNKLALEIDNMNSMFYLVVTDNQIIGYLKLNAGEAQTEIKNSNTLEIERIYVLREYHGKKVGQLLYAKAIEVASNLKVKYVWLGVWEENPRAISFYKKNGFVEFDKHTFTLGNDKQTDIMMRKSIV